MDNESTLDDNFFAESFEPRKEESVSHWIFCIIFILALLRRLLHKRLLNENDVRCWDVLEDNRARADVRTRPYSDAWHDTRVYAGLNFITHYDPQLFPASTM